MTRSNGLQFPLEPLQLLAWALLAIVVLGFYLFVVPSIEPHLAIGLGVLYALLAITATGAGLASTAIDPVDKNVALQAKGLPPVVLSDEEGLQCYLCQIQVYLRSKHCRYCEKCVEEFDHHCRWLNNCIGKRNYRWFICLLCATFGMVLMEICLAIWLLVLYHQERAPHVTDRYDGLRELPFYFIIAILTPLVGLLAQLLGFHSMLGKGAMGEGLVLLYILAYSSCRVAVYKNMTTYEYVIQQQREARERGPKPPCCKGAVAAKPLSVSLG
ncbi:unnamed protein product [Chrysoparadoxa australica]